MAHSARERTADSTAPPYTGRGRPRVLESLRARFRQRLGWRLTASYALVTVAALAVIEVVLFLAGIVWMIVALGQTNDRIAADLERFAAPAAAPFLVSQLPDLNGADRWLRQIQSTGLVAAEEGPPFKLRLDASTLARSESNLLVIDRDGNLVGSLKQNAPPTSLQPAAIANVAELDPAVAAALAGATTTTPILRWPVPKRLFVAVPVRNDFGAIVGAVVFVGQTPFRSSVAALSKVLGAIAVAIILFGAVIATISGYLSARTLVVRFDRMSDAAAAWGAGDFAAPIADGAEDEIGRLGRRLDRMAEQLADLIRARQQLSVVDERNRLARDLHDSVKQQAFAVTLNLGTARELLERDPEAARQRLDAAYDIARQSQQELSTIIRTLRPTELAASSLDQALDRYVAEWRSQTGIVAMADLAADATLPQDVEDALFRVVQEALTNVARHSQATRATVTLRQDGDGISLQVADNGVGFDTRHGRLGVGLQSMRERVEALGGSFAVASGAGGARITIRIALVGTEEN